MPTLSTRSSIGSLYEHAPEASARNRPHDLFDCFDQPDRYPISLRPCSQGGHDAVADDSRSPRCGMAQPRRCGPHWPHSGLARTLDMREATIVAARADRLLAEPDGRLRTRRRLGRDCRQAARRRPRIAAACGLAIAAAINSRYGRSNVLFTVMCE